MASCAGGKGAGRGGRAGVSPNPPPQHGSCSRRGRSCCGRPRTAGLLWTWTGRPPRRRSPRSRGPGPALPWGEGHPARLPGWGWGGTAQGSLCRWHPTHLVLLPHLLSQAQPPVPPAPRRRCPGAHGQSRAAPSGAAARSEPGAVGACARSGSVPCRAAGPGGREARAVEGSQVRPCWPGEAFPPPVTAPAHPPSTASPSPTG